MKTLVVISIFVVIFSCVAIAQPLISQKEVESLVKSVVKEDSILQVIEQHLDESEFTAIVSPQIETVAKKFGYKITLLGKHPKGGLNILVDCPSLKGGQEVQGVCCSNIMEDISGFALTRDEDADQAEVDYGKVYIFDTEHPEENKEIEKTRNLPNEIDKVTYFFTEKQVERVVTMKDGSYDKEIVLP